MQTLIILLLLLVAVAIVLIIIFRAKNPADAGALVTKVDALHASLSKIEGNLKEDFRINREENAGIANANRRELNNTLKDLQATLSQTLQSITQQNQQALAQINRTLDDKVEALTRKIEENNVSLRQTLATSLKDFILEQR